MEIVQLKEKQFEIFLTEDVILEEIDRVAESLNKDLRDKHPLFIVVLNGAFMFASDLIKRFNFPCEISFIRLSSYQGVDREENMKVIHGLVDDIENRHVVVVEDIIDTGHTIAFLLDMINGKKPASVKVASLLFKPSALQLNVKPNYTALEIPNDFIVGYGLDYDGLGRNLRNIYKVRD